MLYSNEDYWYGRQLRGKFLKASGYAFDGQIELISKEEAKDEAEDKAMLQAIAEHYFNLFAEPDKDGAKGNTKDVEL